MQNIFGATVGLFVGLVITLILGTVMFVGYFCFGVLVLANVTWAIELHHWMGNLGLAPWIAVLMIPSVGCTLAGLLCGPEIFTKREV